MNKQAWTAIRATAFLAVAMPLVGCKSDLNQQLLERELRMQEDQIYQLQDELQEKCVRLDRSAGDVSIMVLDPAVDPGISGESVCMARWDIPTQEAITHFRRTSRARGLHFVLRFPGQLPQADHLRLVVRMTAFDGKVFETDSLVATHAKPIP